MQSKTAAVLLGLAGLAFSAQGAIVTFTDRAAFIAAAGGAMTVEGFGDLTLEPGVSLSTGGGYQAVFNSFANCPAGTSSACLGLIESASATFSFSPGITALGFDYNELNATSLDVLDSAGNVFNAALTANFIPGTGYVAKFFGVISDLGLDWATIGSGTDSGGSVYFVDDLRFGQAAAVPTPGTLPLVGLALVALGWRRRAARH